MGVKPIMGRIIIINIDRDNLFNYLGGRLMKKILQFLDKWSIPFLWCLAIYSILFENINTTILIMLFIINENIERRNK